MNIERYMGTWYEIARYENRFEKGCIGATATYTKSDTGMDVINRCLNEQGTITNEAKGRAYVVEKSDNTKLRVSFFWPFYGDYWVIKLGNEYQYSVVGEPSRKYLWILSRNKKLSEKDKRDILVTLPSLGYDPHMLYWTRYP